MTLDPNDPKLTAYALGELDEAERAAVEAEIEASPELQRAVAEIRRAAELLTESLRAEPAPALTPRQREAIDQELQQPAAPAVNVTQAPRSRRRLVLALVSAACVLIAAGVALSFLPIFRDGGTSDHWLLALLDGSDSPDSEPLVTQERRTVPTPVIACPAFPPEPGEEYDRDGQDDYYAPSEGLPDEYDLSALSDDMTESEPLDSPDAMRRYSSPAESSLRLDPGPPMPRPEKRTGLAPELPAEPEPATGTPPTARPGRGEKGQWGSETAEGPNGAQIPEQGEAASRTNPSEGDRTPGRTQLEQLMDPLQSGERRPREEGRSPSEPQPDPAGQGRPLNEDREAQNGQESSSERPFGLAGSQSGRSDAEAGGESSGLRVRGHADDGRPPVGEDRQSREGTEGGKLHGAGGAEFNRIAGPDPIPGFDNGKGNDEDKDPTGGDAKPETSKPPATWRRARATPNASRLMIGDQEDLPLEGMQANVQVDGFRARVLVDYYFYNDRDRQYEGTFKLRLPNNASLYFFAFGESSYRYRPQEKPKDVRGAFITVSYTRPGGNDPEGILQARADTWQAPKVARVVPREKAAFAYRQTVRRRVDPALVEWSGAGVFSARVFPLAPKKLHQIVVGYDVDLVRTGDGLEYKFDLPEVTECAVDVNLAAWAGGSATITPDVKPFMSNGRAYYHIADPPRQISLRLEDPGTVLLTGADEKTGDYFAASLRPELPAEKEGAGASTALFLVDTSLSSNPDRFNVWLKLLRATLDGNRDTIERFAVLWFNVEAHWWQEKFAANTPENVKKLLDEANTLSLEGATDLGQAFKQAASPSWFTAQGKVEPWDVFLLSDGALTWGESNVHRLTAALAGEASHAGALFAYQTGMAGTESRVLDHLARETGGAVFSVIGEAEVAKAARAHRSRPWQLAGVELAGGRDLLLAGRPKTIFPGQQLVLVGRDKPKTDAPVVLKLHRGGQDKTVEIKTDRTIDSELAPRVYGQVAVGQLESLGGTTEEMSASYARHFRVTGQTCSLLMLESEADYQRFNIEPEDDAFVVTSSPVTRVLGKALVKAGELLLDPKAAFQAWLARMEQTPGVSFRVSPALKVAVESLPRGAFEVAVRPLRCKERTWEDMPGELKENLSIGKVEYDAILAEAERRMRKHGEADALRVFSSLVEHSPGDLVLARDVAYSAMAWGLPDQAYHLLNRVATARPNEPQMFLAMAQSLVQTGNPDLAVLYYEVALNGTWDDRFRDFRRIVSVDYLHFLRQIAGGKQKTSLKAFAAARLDRIAGDVGLETADLVVTIQWNTDGTDVDLHVHEPTGEVCNYQHRQTKIGGRLTADCTQGFGPEMYTLAAARHGKYDVKVHYFSTDANRAGTRTKVYATIYEGWGTKQERRIRKAVALAQHEDTHDIATIGIEK